jgi:hypothetical protein
MRYETIEIQITNLHKKEYRLLYDGDRNTVRLVGYKELVRESTRKRIYKVMRWYDWYNKRDRHDDRFIPVEQIELPFAVKQNFVNKLIADMTFITTESR